MQVFIIGSLLFIIGIILMIIGKKITPEFNRKNGHIIVIVIGIIMVLVSSIRIVGPGEVGVQILFGKVLNNILYSGMHIVPPVIDIKTMSVRTEAYTMSGKQNEGQIKGDDAISVLTSDGLQIKMDVTVWYHLDPVKAAEVYRTIGPNYVEKIVRPAVRTAIRDAAVHFSATDIYSNKRKEVVDMISSSLEKDLGVRGIVFEKMLLRNVILPTRIQQAIDEKIAAEQEAQKMEYVLQKEKKEAERKKIEAEGIAKAQKIIANSLTEKYLSWYYIQTMKELVNSPNNTVIITPFDQKLIPLLDTKTK